MSDATSLYRSVIAQTTQFVQVLDQLELLADRFQTDFALFAQAANAASVGGRSDLVAQDFDNFVGAVTAIKQANVGTVKAYLYKML